LGSRFLLFYGGAPACHFPDAPGFAAAGLAAEADAAELEESELDEAGLAAVVFPPEDSVPEVSVFDFVSDFLSALASAGAGSAAAELLFGA